MLHHWLKACCQHVAQDMHKPKLDRHGLSVCAVYLLRLPICSWPREHADKESEACWLHSASCMGRRPHRSVAELCEGHLCPCWEGFLLS